MFHDMQFLRTLLFSIFAGLFLCSGGMGMAQDSQPPVEDGPAVSGQVDPAISDSKEKRERDGKGENDQGAPPSSTAGKEAVQRVRKLGFRLSNKEALNDIPARSQTEENSPVTSTNPVAPSEMRLGRVSEPVALPPTLTKLAQEGALAVADGHWEAARDIFLKIVQEAPDNSLAYANLGVAEHELGNLRAAEGNLSKSTELNPHLARNWQTLGLIQYEKGSFALAISSLMRSIHEDPDESETRVILAAVLRDYGWPRAAVTELERAVELNPKSPTAHYNLAVSYLEDRPARIELARRHYYAAIDLGAAPSPDIEGLIKAAPSSRE